MYKLHLETAWDNCPVIWKNFTNHIERLEDVADGDGVAQYLDGYLGAYGAKYIRGFGIMDEDYVEFDLHEDAVAFELRFG